MATRSLLHIIIVLVASATMASAGTKSMLASLSNEGFENPSLAAGAPSGERPRDWLDFASEGGIIAGVTDEKKRSGMQSVLLKCQDKEDAFHGLFQKFNAEPRFRYSLSIYALKDAKDGIVGSSYGQLQIEWKDNEGKEISREYGPSWNYELSATRWEKFTVDATAPEGVDHGIATIIFFSGDSGGFGTCYVDDAEIESKKP